MKILLFAQYAEALGRSELEMEVPAGSTVATVLERITQLAGSERIPPAPMVAINQTYALLSDAVQPSDEIAIIPPVAGG